MLKLKSRIVEEDIYKVVALAQGHPVFKIEGFGHDSGFIDAIVIKQEPRPDRRQIQSNLRLMHIVDPKARTHVLHRSEVAALMAWCSEGGLGDSMNAPEAREIRNYMTQGGAWTKMELKTLTLLDDAMDKRLQGDKADVRFIARALKQSGGLEKLGEIIAVDLFVGNQDRFYYPSGYGKKLDCGQKLKCLGNVGNVFIASGANDSGAPIGLDGFDPNNYYRNFSIPLDNENAWQGIVLGNANALKDWVGDVVWDLEYVLGPRNRKNPFGSKNRLGKDRKARILSGIAHGLGVIKADTLRRYNQTDMPPGLQTRGSYLGWW